MKKFLKFILKFIFIVLILLLFVSYCSYDLLSRASVGKLENIGSQMFGSKLVIGKELSNGEKYTIVIENPQNFAAGNMILLKNIEDSNKNNRNIIISGLTVNYAINKNNQINLHEMRDNVKKFAEANLKSLNDINKMLSDVDGKQNSTNKKTPTVHSITFINPTLLLFIDDKYQGITTIPSFSLQYNNDAEMTLLKGALDSVTHLTTQADKAVLNLMKK